MFYNQVHLLGIKVYTEIFTMYLVLCNSVWTCFIVIDVQNDFLTHILRSNFTMVKKSYFLGSSKCSLPPVGMWTWGCVHTKFWQPP